MKLKKPLSVLLCASALLTSSLTACTAPDPTPHTYADDQFILSSFWAPYEITEESFTTYKNCNLNTVQLTNHSRDVSDAEAWSPTDPVMSANRYYLGSDLTKQTLDLCKKMGLYAVLEDNGAWFDTGDTPYSTRESYEEYRDIIVGMHVADEPSNITIPNYCTPSRVADYKSTYGDLPFMINLFPTTASVTSLATLDYNTYLQTYAQNVLENFSENPLVSVDYYPFHKYADKRDGFTQPEAEWLDCYEKIATMSVKYNATTHFYIQSAENNEFMDSLSEIDMRLQLYVGLCYGGTRFTYFCYSIPGSYSAENGLSDPKYTACLVDENNQPTHLYNYVKEINAELQAFASAFKAYRFVRCMPVYTQDETSPYFRSELTVLRNQADFSDRKYVENVTTAGSCLVGCFEREADEAYTLVNYAYESVNDVCEATVRLKEGATHLAVYGGEGFDGTPVVLKAKNGECTVQMKAGEGKFIVPLCAK